MPPRRRSPIITRTRAPLPVSHFVPGAAPRVSEPAPAPVAKPKYNRFANVAKPRVFNIAIPLCDTCGGVADLPSQPKDLPLPCRCDEAPETPPVTGMRPQDMPKEFTPGTED